LTGQAHSTDNTGGGWWGIVLLFAEQRIKIIQNASGI